MGDVLASKDTVLSDRIPATEKPILGYEATTIGPSLFVLGKDFVDDVGSVPDVVVPDCDELPIVSIICILRLPSDPREIDCRQ